MQMNHHHRRRIIKAAAAAAIAGPAWSALAQTMSKDQQIRLVVPFSPGGGVDVIGRAVAEQMTRQFGLTVIVDNRTGAGGNIGSTAVAKANPDGLTLLVASNSNAYNDFLYGNAGYDPAKDLVRVVEIGTVPMVLLVSQKVSPTTVQEVIAMAKQSPQSLNFASGGNGTAEHLVAEQFKRRVGIDVLHVPYRGGANVYTDMIAGQVQLFFNNQLGAMPFVKSGQLKAVGVAAPSRSKQLPDVPTFAEQGFGKLTSSQWLGLSAPKGLPEPIAEKMTALIPALLETPVLRQRCEELATLPRRPTPLGADFVKVMRDDIGTWTAIAKQFNIVQS
jgi:tripartite-type tricarboxylate transporter receptor subunit TctC